MEFYGENSYLKNALPPGYYKYQYSQFSPMKLELSLEQVQEYWKENNEEYDWECGYKLLSVRESFEINKSLNKRKENLRNS